MSGSLPEKHAVCVYVVHEMEVSFWRFDWPAFLRALETGQTNRLITNLDGHALNGSFENPATSQPFRSLQFQNARSVLSRTCSRLKLAVSVSSVKTMSFNQMKRQEAQSRMAAVRKARRSPAAAAALQRRASLVGDGAKWRITNLNQVARAIARWP